MQSGRPSRRLHSSISPSWDALRGLGYIEGRNLTIEWRFAEGRGDPLLTLAEELVRLKVDVIFTVNTPATRAAKNATSTIPIVFTAVADSAAAKLVASLARPGGNLTGLTTLVAETSGKRLELLKEALPKVSRAAVLWNSSSEGAAFVFRGLDTASRQLGIQLQDVGVRSPTEIERAFEAATRGRAGVLLVIDDQVITSHRKRIVDLAGMKRLPVVSLYRDFVEAGGLVSYGPSATESFRRAAFYVDKILKGAKPADLPVEQPTTFELVINLKTARALGLTIPASLLSRADQVIE
jgi:ABC-type uncharacterized transport system substrate-binding protein